jgi:hypothetical protein
MAAAFHQVLQYRLPVASMLLAEFGNQLESSALPAHLIPLLCRSNHPRALVMISRGGRRAPDGPAGAGRGPSLGDVKRRDPSVRGPPQQCLGDNSSAAIGAAPRGA